MTVTVDAITLVRRIQTADNVSYTRGSDTITLNDAYPQLRRKTRDNPQDPFWHLALGVLPVHPNSICFRSPGGVRPHPTLLLDYPSLQVFGRGVDYIHAEQVMYEVKDILLGWNARQDGELNRLFSAIPGFYRQDGEEKLPSGDIWAVTNLSTDVGFVGEDTNSWFEFSMNMNFIVEPDDKGRSNRIPLPTAAMGT